MIQEFRARENRPSQADLGRDGRAPEVVPPQLSIAERASLERLEQLLKPTASVDLGALRQHVYEHPHDDAPRAVLADALSEQGDPLGEFITLQLASYRQSPSRREAELLRTHAVRWLGALEPFVYQPTQSWLEVFERGFPAKVRLQREANGTVLTQSEQWATVEDLRLPYGFQFEPPYPALRGLRRLEGLTNRPAHPLPPLEELVVRADLITTLRITGVNHLGLLGFNADGLEQLIRHSARLPWFSAVRSLGIGMGLTALTLGEALLARLPTLHSVVCSRAIGHAFFESEQWWERLSRGGALTCVWHGRNSGGEKATAVADVLTPERVRALTVLRLEQRARMPASERAAVVQAVKQALAASDERPRETVLFGIKLLSP